MKPQGIPANYVQISTGEWCHPSRVPPNKSYPMQEGGVAKFINDAICGPPTHQMIMTNPPIIEPCPKPPKRIRQSSKPLMNKLESEWLEVLKTRFRIVTTQSLRFMLGNGIWYKPDFVAWPTGLESQDLRMRAFEVKGPRAFRGGFENLKVAAHQYPQIKWTLVWKQDGQWKEQVVLP